MGTIPVRGMRPTVGLMPTSELAAAGLRINPDVSVPTVSGANPTAADTAEPELDGMLLVRKFANSLRFALARMIAPARRRSVTRGASPAGKESASATEPAVVGRPATSMLSLTITGMPSSGPCGLPEASIPSAAATSRRASGLITRTAFSDGAREFTLEMRSRYARVNATLLILCESSS